MGSPLSPALVNIFVGYQKTKLFLNVKKPPIYYRCVDDIFAVSESEDDFEKFSSLNSLHSSLHFTLEKELHPYLPFLDVLVEKHKLDLSHLCIRNPPLPANTYIGIILAL